MTTTRAIPHDSNLATQHTRLNPRAISLLMLLVGSAAFAAVAADVRWHGPLVWADRMLAAWLHAHAVQGPVIFAEGCAGLGDWRVQGPLLAVALVWLIFHRRWRVLAAVAVGVGGGALLCEGLKHAFSAGFPSGHTMRAVILAGMWALCGMQGRPAVHRRIVAALVVLLGLLVAASLVYIGVHALTDVLAGLAASLAWLGVMHCALVIARNSFAQIPSAPVE